ncbi:hypothetical protein [Stenotrophomonas sp. RG-453]|uniref:hypothetical protein n=1 Tax=Stenotrophomonas sp. RG-453 TaxID=2957502 RepID=UPI0029CA1A2D|nr:hypothetical protein [Stenotrophomonas sp. RG-453]MDX5515091.1 hypothetical protein [Stenotrophomonas sp. RG-453]
MDIPLHSYELIDRLDELYPEAIYNPKDCREEFLLRQGERRLILKLKELRLVEIKERNRR